MFKTKKLFRVYFSPLISLSIFFGLNALVLILYFQKTNDFTNTYLLAAQAGITIVSAGAGIFIPLQINRNLDKEKDRRTLAFTLGLILHELIYNEFLVKNISDNFSLEEALSYTGKDFISANRVLKSKIETLAEYSKMLTSSSFISSQSSGTIKTFPTDNLLNDVIAAYDSLKDIQTEIATIFGNTRKNINLIKDESIISFSNEDEEMIKKDLRIQIKRSQKRVKETKNKVSVATNTIDSELTKLGVKLDTE
jgi:hypothetical protein